MNDYDARNLLTLYKEVILTRYGPLSSLSFNNRETMDILLTRIEEHIVKKLTEPRLPTEPYTESSYPAGLYETSLDEEGYDQYGHGKSHPDFGK